MEKKVPYSNMFVHCKNNFFHFQNCNEIFSYLNKSIIDINYDTYTMHIIKVMISIVKRKSHNLS